MKVLLNDEFYDLQIIDDNFVAQSDKQDLVYHNGYNLLKKEASDLYHKIDPLQSTSEKEFISEYINAFMVHYCKNNLNNVIIILND